MIEWKSIEAVNKAMQLTDIKGKPYADVKERVRAFRKLCPNGYIKTEIVEIDESQVIVKATIGDENILATGFAWEQKSTSRLNETSMVEVAETSAVGRALGFLGLGIQTSIATAEEVKQTTKATHNQIDAILRSYHNEPEMLMDVMEHFGIGDIEELGFENATKLISKISSNGWKPIGAEKL